MKNADFGHPLTRIEELRTAFFLKTGVCQQTPKRWLTILAIVVAGTGDASRAAAQSAQQMNRQGSADLAAGKLDAAVVELQAAARRFPDDKRIEFNLGLALVRKARLKEAVAPLQQAAQDPNLAAEAEYALGADYFESKQYEQAIAELRGLENGDRAERVLYMMEESNRRTGRIADAKSAFHQLLTRFPDSAWTHYLMGTAYEDRQELDKAVEEYKLALEKDPRIPNANFAIGYIYWRQQDMDKAGEWLQKETLSGCHALANYYLGQMAATEDDLPKAEALYRRALQCDPSNSDAHLRLGIVLGRRKRYAEAVGQFKEAIRLDPGGSSAHYHLATVYKQMGRTADAEKEYRTVRQLEAASDKGVDVTGGVKP